MLDENLPTFHLCATDVKHNVSLALSQHGDAPIPSYIVRHPDPAAIESRNRYAAALYDSHNADILYGEVLLPAEWASETASSLPAPMLPGEFVVQLYNPDQQIVVRWRQSIWGSPTWEFEMPQQSFRQPSTSTLDRTQDDPLADSTTPRLTFKWKKDSKLSKDYVCVHSGRSVDVGGQRKRDREPDITLALFRNLREITLYESNLTRVEMEDAKGLEVVLLLSALLLRDVYNSPLREAFCISGPPTPEVNPDVETQRLKKQLEHEERKRQRADTKAARRMQQALDEQDRCERQEQVDRETERLQKLFAQEQALIRQNTGASVMSGGLSPRPNTTTPAFVQSPRPSATPYLPRPNSTTPYLAHNLPQAHHQTPAGRKSSLWSTLSGRRDGSEAGGRLSKTRSVVF